MKTPVPDVEAAVRSNPGETLRNARESLGRSLEDVAAQLNLSVRTLKQVEAGAFDQLPGHTFARGYIRAYAKVLDMDQDLLVREFDIYTGTDAQGSSVQGLGRIEEPVRLSQNILRLVSFLLLAGLGFICFLWWQGQSPHDIAKQVGLAEHVEVEGADGTTQIHPLDEPEEAPVVAAGSEAEAPSVQVPAEVVAQSVPAAPAVVQPLVPEQASPAASVAASPAAGNTVATQPPAPAAAGEAQVSLKFSADCWTQLKDAQGKVLFSALKRAGETVVINGKAPLELRLGFARGVEVSVNGQPVDIAPFTSGETARVKLGQ